MLGNPIVQISWLCYNLYSLYFLFITVTIIILIAVSIITYYMLVLFNCKLVGCLLKFCFHVVISGCCVCTSTHCLLLLVRYCIFGLVLHYFVLL